MKVNDDHNTAMRAIIEFAFVTSRFDNNSYRSLVEFFKFFELEKKLTVHSMIKYNM